MPNLSTQLILDRCPHCKIAHPSLHTSSEFTTKDFKGGHIRCWMTYRCTQCGGVVLASSPNSNGHITEMYPESKIVDSVIPEPAKEYLKQAINSLHAPSASIMVAASSIDAMLKTKGYTEGGLYPRINKAATDHLITDEMAKWAHQVRLGANGQRHADGDYEMPTQEEAQRLIDFTQALAEFLFVLPAKVEQGVASTTPTEV
ncbi:DUF4145 domain-containing protein [Labilibaculum antarcticum]|uniref:DUF4145 domain-containing protein n=1 Tax=Labilibaculum antarcticum TaxID=1717717 RepID=A0A1Y1CNI9_9BACT|nr:DUF4145 domain-containing protein [Labilibaculum antarcticum]BAX81977.1 hypothetical protein ALGA_3685 [Labilibaculum antarcticum]